MLATLQPLGWQDAKRYQPSETSRIAAQPALEAGRAMRQAKARPTLRRRHAS